MRTAAVTRAAMLLTAVLALPALGETVTWTGSGGNLDWTNPANWDKGHVPGSGDAVVVPYATPSCWVPDGYQVEVQSIENHNIINSAGDLNITTSGQLENHEHGEFYSGQSMNLKVGTDFTNQGTAHGANVEVSCGSFDNNATGVVATLNGGADNSINITSSGHVTNAGQITGGNSGGTNPAGSVHIKCGMFTNTNTVAAGQAQGSGQGGAFTLNCQGVENSGHCSAGSSNSGQGGNTVIAVDGGLVNSGHIHAGNGHPAGATNVTATVGISNEGWIGEQGSWQEPGDVLLAAEMVYLLQTETLQVRSRNLTVVACRMMLGTMGRGPWIHADETNRFYLAATGTYITMEELDTAGVSAGVGNYVFADSIQPPPMGYALAFDPDPVIAGTDTLRRGAVLSGLDGADSAGASGSLSAWLVNLSSSAQAVGYSISSVLGWVTPASGTTVPLDPFAMDSFPVGYAIPRGASRTDCDTIVAILRIPPSYCDTTRFRLACSRDTVYGIAEWPTSGLRSQAPSAAIVRGVLSLEVDCRQHTAYRAGLLDISGRKALELHPGPNDVSRLAPGVYFVRPEPSAVSRQPS
ncbi:hypothetical protein FJY70_04225, partial [candidate division WOR-3 bacterium]|nr:hypothetical protein [candidate division WOR-3 bacterium]